MTRKISSLWLVLCVAVALPVAAQQQKKIKESDLVPKYQEWLNLVTYIILPQEKDVFLRLSNDFERDIFINAFWKQRDPTPGTPENEYKQEMEKRFLYVNKEFHKDTPRPGWMTDRGRIYMILGEPQSRDKISAPEVQPCELWTYYGDVSKDQPTYFGLIFFRRGGSGEYQLYSPSTDGPTKLAVYMPGATVNGEALDGWMQDATKVYQYIREHAPDVAPFVLSIVPNDVSFEMDASLSSETRLAQILESPRKDINPAYATHFMNYKGIVSTDYLTNFVDSEATVAILNDPLEGIPFLHFSIAPKNISVDFYEPRNQYYCNYSVDVSLKKGENFVFQLSKDFSYYFPREDSAKVAANGIAIQDSFPVVAGNYRLTVLLRNSVGKEFSLLEKDITVDATQAPRIAGPLVGYKLEESDKNSLLAFKIFDQRVYVDAKNNFSPTDTIVLLYNVENLTEELWKQGEIQVAVKGAKAVSPAEKSLSVQLNRQPFRKTICLSQSIAASELVPDYYEATVSLVDRGRLIETKTATFIISPSGAMARPVILAKSFPRSSIHLEYLALAGEAEKAGDMSGAEAYFQKALFLVPDDPEANDFYCGFLMRTKQYERTLGLIEKVKADPTLRFDYFIIKGKALRELGRCEEAIPLLLEGNKIYNSDTRLLNALGYCYYRTGKKALALEILNASIRLNADQPDLKKLIEEISKK
jgi:GWxTD domain-containing protein